MTRSGGGLAELFATSADAAVLRVLHDCGRALVKSEILDALAKAGVARATADDAWGPVQKRLRLDHRVIAERDGPSMRYRWNPAPPAQPGPADALAMLVEGRLTRGEREVLAEAIRASLGAPSSAVPSSAVPSSPVPSEPPPAAAASANALSDAGRLRQAELDAARELVGLAADVEEQVAKGASAKALVHKVRSRMKRLRLEPIDRAGESVPFERGRHLALRPGIADGAPVLVIRPGYVWRMPGEEIVIDRPVVQD